MKKPGKVVSFFLDVDVLLTPTCVTPAPELGGRPPNSFLEDRKKWAEENVGAFSPHLSIVNASGQPAASVPTHVSRGGLPVGVQVVARQNDERTLLQLAGALETAFPWREGLRKLGTNALRCGELAHARRERPSAVR